MLVYNSGDLFRSECRVYVNTVNCVGVMGKGIAKQFKWLFPKLYEDYRAECLAGNMKIGKMYVWKNPEGHPKYIINFPTKNEWTKPSSLEFIRLGLLDLKRVIIEMDLTSIAMPALGCNNGGLAWEDVQKLIEDFYKDLKKDIKIEVYKPGEK